MYHKIVNHYKQYLNSIKQNKQGTGSKKAKTEESQASTNSPTLSNNQDEEILSPSKNLDPIPGSSHRHDEDISSTSENLEPIPGPSHRQNELVTVPKETEKLTDFSPSFTAVKVFENEEIEVFVQKSLHKRLKTFKMQDSLFHVKVKVKNNRSPPLIKDLLMVLDKAFNFILANIRTFFKDDEENIVYMTLIQSPMVNGLNSAGFHLQDNSSSEMIDQILNMLQRFLISDNNINLEINDTFKVYVHVLSVDHVEYKRRHPRAKQKNIRKKHYGAQNSKNSLNYIWAIDVPKGYDNNINVFENKCLLMSIILGHLQNEYYKSERTDKRFFLCKEN